MSYSISEAVVDSAREGTALRELQVRFPNAEMLVLPDGRSFWSNATIEPSGFLVVVHGKDRVVILVPYEKVAGVHVVAPPPAWRLADTFFAQLAEEEPKTHAALLARWS